MNKINMEQLDPSKNHCIQLIFDGCVVYQGRAGLNATGADYQRGEKFLSLMEMCFYDDLIIESLNEKQEGKRK